jgi:hypothetical protein
VAVPVVRAARVVDLVADLVVIAVRVAPVAIVRAADVASLVPVAVAVPVAAVPVVIAVRVDPVAAVVLAGSVAVVVRVVVVVGSVALVVRVPRARPPIRAVSSLQTVVRTPRGSRAWALMASRCHRAASGRASRSARMPTGWDRTESRGIPSVAPSASRSARGR